MVKLLATTTVPFFAATRLVAPACRNAVVNLDASTSTIPARRESTPSSASLLHRLTKYRALVLDSGYRPIDVLPWQRALCLDIFDKVDVLEYYDASDASVRSARAEHPIPAVLRVRFYVKRNVTSFRMSLSRKNVLLRDKFTCQYCHQTHSHNSANLTIDHVIPASKGGGFTWENLVTACNRCNARKGDKSLKSLGWKLKKAPMAPSPYEMGVLFGINLCELSRPPKEWSDYLFPVYGVDPANDPNLQLPQPRQPMPQQDAQAC